MNHYSCSVLSSRSVKYSFHSFRIRALNRLSQRRHSSLLFPPNIIKCLGTISCREGVEEGKEKIGLSLNFQNLNEPHVTQRAPYKVGKKFYLARKNVSGQENLTKHKRNILGLNERFRKKPLIFANHKCAIFVPQKIKICILRTRINKDSFIFIFVL